MVNKTGRSQCPHCQKYFKGGMYYLRIHLRRRHGGIAPVMTVTAFETMGRPNAEKSCVCKICDASFDRIVKLRKHMRAHVAADDTIRTRIEQMAPQMYQITNCGGWELSLSDSETDADDSGADEFDDSTMPTVLRNNTRRTHTCGSCSRSYDRRYRLIMHMEIEHEQTKLIDFAHLQCAACKEPYPSEEILAKHRRDQCDAVHKKFTCAECGSRFEWASSLEQHTIKAHEKKDFYCGICSKQFTRVQDYTRHQKVHRKRKMIETSAPTSNNANAADDGEPAVKKKSYARDALIYPREFIADGCRRVGDYKGRRGGSNGIKTVTCDICQRQFSRKDNLVYASLSGFFPIRNRLTNTFCSGCSTHFRVHFPKYREQERANQDGFLCEHCGRNFRTSSNLNGERYSQIEYLFVKIDTKALNNSLQFTCVFIQAKDGTNAISAKKVRFRLIRLHYENGFLICFVSAQPFQDPKI